MTTSSARAWGRTGARASIVSSGSEVFCSATSRSSGSGRWVTAQRQDAGRRVPALQDRQQLGGREGRERLVGRRPDPLVGVADEVRPQLDEVLRLEREEPLRGHEAQVARDAAAAELLDQGVGGPRFRHER